MKLSALIFSRSPIWLCILAILGLTLAARPAAAQVGDVTRVHDPSIIKAGDVYYLFCTGNGIPVRTSKDLIHWTNAGRVFDQPPAWAATEVPGFRNSLWAPDISFRDGKFYLYYSVSTFGSRRSCIGLATNAALDPQDPKFKWEDQGKVVETLPDKNNFNAIDPNLALDADGTPWLALGSFWDGLKICKLDAKTGKPAQNPPDFTGIAKRGGDHSIEAAFIVRCGNWFYLFASFDHCCRGVNSDYNIRVGRSEKIDGPYADKDGKAMMDGGGTMVLETSGARIGPGHEAVLQDGDKWWLVHHMYDGNNNGMATLQIRPLTWSDDGWPVAGLALKETDAKPAAAAVK